jgi:hypothetical protein
MEKEISKNKIILFLFCIIIFLGTVCVLPKIIRWENDQKPYRIGSDSSYILTSHEIFVTVHDSIDMGPIKVLTDSLTLLRKENAKLKAQLSQKINPVGLRVIPYYDTMDLRAFIHTDTMVSHRKYYQSKWSEDSDTTWVNDSVYFLNSQLPQNK